MDLRAQYLDGQQIGVGEGDLGIAAERAEAAEVGLSRVSVPVAMNCSWTLTVTLGRSRWSRSASR
jgi:hypothetical protein